MFALFYILDRYKSNTFCIISYSYPADNFFLILYFDRLKTSFYTVEI